MHEDSLAQFLWTEPLVVVSHMLHIWYYSVDLSLMSKSKHTPIEIEPRNLQVPKFVDSRLWSGNFLKIPGKLGAKNSIFILFISYFILFLFY